MNKIPNVSYYNSYGHMPVIEDSHLFDLEGNVNKKWQKFWCNLKNIWYHLNSWVLIFAKSNAICIHYIENLYFLRIWLLQVKYCEFLGWHILDTPRLKCVKCVRTTPWKGSIRQLRLYSFDSFDVNKHNFHSEVSWSVGNLTTNENKYAKAYFDL